MGNAVTYTHGVVEKCPEGVVLAARLVPDDKTLLPPNQESRLVGTVTLSFSPKTREEFSTLPIPPNAAYLSNMAVDPKFRRSGVAKALLEACDRAVALTGLQDVHLHVRKSDSGAQELYTRRGYAEIDRDGAFKLSLQFKAGPSPRILMKKTLA